MYTGLIIEEYGLDHRSDLHMLIFQVGDGSVHIPFMTFHLNKQVTLLSEGDIGIQDIDQDIMIPDQVIGDGFIDRFGREM